MINGVLLDSIGLALFSLAWWGWLIGGGLAVVGMLFGVHVAVGAPEAQAYSSSYTLEEYAAMGDIGAMAKLAQQSQYGYSGPSKEAQMADALSSGDTDRYFELKGDTQAQLGNALSRGDIGAAADYAQQMQQESSGTSSGSYSSSSPSSSSGSGSSGGYSAPDGSTWVSKAAYDDWHRDYDAEYAQWQKDMAAWEAQYGSGASGGGGGSAPAAPSSPGQPNLNSTGAVYSGSLSAQFPDPYGNDADVEAWERYKTNGGTDYFAYADLKAEAKRQFDHGKPLVMKVQTTGYETFTQSFTDLAQGTIQGEGQINHEAAKLAASALVAGEIQKHGGIDAALENAQGVKAHQASMYQGYLDNPPASNDQFADPSEHLAMATIADFLVEALIVEKEAQSSAAMSEVSVPFKAKGTKVDPTYTASDDGGTLDIAMKAKARAGSTVKIKVMEYNADKGRMVVVDTTKAKVGKGGKIHTAVEADAGDVIMVKKNTGKKLAQIEIPGQ